MAKKTEASAAAPAKKPRATPATKAKTAAGRKPKAAAAKKGPAAAAPKPGRRKALSLKIVSPHDGDSPARAFKVQCKGTGVSAVDVTISRTALTKKAKLVGGFWEATIAKTDITPTPSGKQDTIGASGMGASGSVGAPPIKVVIK